MEINYIQSLLSRKNLSSFVLGCLGLILVSCGGGGGGESDTLTTIVPNDPSELSAITISESSIDLSWVDNADDEASYVVQRSTTTGSGFTTLATLETNSISYEDNIGLTASTTYYYRIYAKNSAGVSGYSNEASATTDDIIITIPTAPIDPIATATSSASINLVWTDTSSNETGFRIDRSTSSTMGFSTVGDVSANIASFTDNTGLSASTTYYYRVVATNSAGDAVSSTTASATTWAPPVSAPIAPFNLSATASSSSSIDLSWTDASSDEANFIVQSSMTSDGVFTTIATLDAGITTFNSIGLSAATTYYFRVYASNSVGDSGYSNEVSATTNTAAITPPPAPSGLSATATSSSSIDLGWTYTSSSETGFRIERSTSSNTGFTAVGTVAADITSYTDSFGLSASTTYYYRMVATNSAGDSIPSTTASAMTWAPPVTVPPAPNGVTATATSTSSIDLSWTYTSSSETGFRIERSTSSSTGFAVVGTVAADITSYTDNSGLIASTSYYYRVLATNSAGDSAPSNTANATTWDPPVLPPVAPGNLTATATSSSSIDLSWTQVTSGETGFRVERSTSSTTGFTPVGNVAANITSFTDSFSLSASTTYYYHVVATSSVGDSDSSNTASATTSAPPVTIPSAPSSLSAFATSSSAITLNWTDTSANETGFKIERSLSSNSGFVQIGTVGLGVTTYFSGSLASSTTYYYRVAATNSAGSSPYSNTANATTNVDTASSAPVLTLVSNTNGDITLEWTYDDWGGLVCSCDGYVLEESTSSASSGFVTILDTKFTGDRATPKSYAVPTHFAGTYYYRVRAYDSSVYSAYSNVLAITVLSTVVTNTYTVTADNLIMISSQDSSIANTSYSNAGNSVGCNWVYSSITGIQDYVCADSLVYFDVNADISNKTIISATLKLYPEILPASYNTQYKAWAIFDNWTNSVTWNSMPQMYTGSGILFNPPGSSLPSEIDVTNIVQNWASGSYNNYGFFVEDSNYGFPYAIELRSTTYYSKFSGSDPELVITYQ